MKQFNQKLSVSIIGSRGYPIVYSGYETFVKELAERLVVKGFTVTVYCHKNLFTNRPKALNGIRLVYIPTIESKVLSQLIHSFLSMTHACLGKSNVILTVNAANGPWGIIARLFNKKTAINVDGLEWLRPKWKGLGARYFKMAAWLSTRLYNRIITDAEAMRQVYLKEFNRDSTVIAYGANIRYSKEPHLIDQFALESGSYYLIVGRLIPDNNSDLLLEGFLASHSSKKLVIVGDVPYQDTYANKMKSRASDAVIFTGYVTDAAVLAELYHHCYAYLHGHEFGGTNPTMLKAMAYGCAILALETVFNREMLADGAFGRFYQKNVLSVSEQLVAAENSPEEMQQLRKNARNGLTLKYQWDAITDAYIQVFEELQGLNKSA